MSLFRRNPRRDASEPAIRAALEQVGVKVEPLSGAGIPDLACLTGNRVFFIECKTKGGRVTEAQRMFANDGWPVYLARTPEQALMCLRMFKDKAL